MAASGNEFRAETASGLDLGRPRSAADPNAAQRLRRALIELDRTGLVPPLFLPRARLAARLARHFRVERGTV